MEKINYGGYLKKMMILQDGELNLREYCEIKL
jgi:hypothetical protein